MALAEAQSTQQRPLSFVILFGEAIKLVHGGDKSAVGSEISRWELWWAVARVDEGGVFLNKAMRGSHPLLHHGSLRGRSVCGPLLCFWIDSVVIQ